LPSELDNYLGVFVELGVATVYVTPGGTKIRAQVFVCFADNFAEVMALGKLLNS